MTIRFALHRSRGISLIEALVALAIMAIGMLGMVGVQSTLRSSSDIAKQRSEAVRIAQETIETWRAFLTLTGGPGTNYNALLAGVVVDPDIVGTNATYTRSRNVTFLPAPRRGKTLAVSVTWVDRAGQPQRVDLTTLIAGISPELGNSVVVRGAGDVIQQPRGRKGGIPSGAKDLGGGRSGWIPPGAPTGVAWVFNNATGVITLCTTTSSTIAGLIYDTASPGSNTVTCTADVALYVGGFVRYALGTTQPAPADAVNPPSKPSETPAFNQVTVSAKYTLSGFPLTQSCYVLHVDGVAVNDPSYSEYHCAVPALVIPNVPPSWSGSLAFGPDTSLISTTPADTSAALLKVCRYHLAASYSGQTEPLANQNFLMIRSGDGAPTTPTAYTCPTPFTHQPL